MISKYDILFFILVKFTNLIEWSIFFDVIIIVIT